MVTAIGGRAPGRPRDQQWGKLESEREITEGGDAGRRQRPWRCSPARGGRWAPAAELAERTADGVAHGTASATASTALLSTAASGGGNGREEAGCDRERQEMAGEVGERGGAGRRYGAGPTGGAHLSVTRKERARAVGLLGLGLGPAQLRRTGERGREQDVTVHTLEGEGRGALAPRSAIWSKVAPPPSGGQATVRREGGALPSTAVVAGRAESIHGYARSSRGGT
uniref:Uncharacterized protein n=1 Tax=Oryza sativa subsp. japonica TaxID=39947 RepID=Q9AY88_ORYSJ|nr:hypothetical protein [Oryza sativa Japonica Group]